jgi:lysophospholipase L1-like esterase
VKHAPRIALFASALALFAGTQAMSDSTPATQSGPTPYPTSNDAWPGTGVVRTFGWMKDNRNFFWTERAKKQGAIVFAGDSLTANWKSLGADFSGTLVANRGIGGDVSRGLLFRFQEDVLDLHPKAIVILIGINDLTARQPASATVANIRSMLSLKETQQPQVPVFLCTVPPSANPKAPVDEQQRRQLNQGLRQIAQDSKLVTLVDLYAATATNAGAPERHYFTDDQLHLSADGRARWKEVLQPVMQRAGVL